MKKFTLTCQRYGLWKAFPAVVLSGFLLTPSLLSAMPVVTTVSGGPSQQNHNSNGYTDGDTKLLAQFNTPIGLALDSSGNLLFVADRDNNAIRTLNLSGNLTFTFTTEEISQPVGVAVDAQGNVYVLNFADGGNGSVVKFDAFGGLLGTIASGLPQANGIALDQSGNVYVT